MRIITLLPYKLALIGGKHHFIPFCDAFRRLKKVALILAMSIVATSCSGANEDTFWQYLLKSPPAKQSVPAEKTEIKETVTTSTDEAITTHIIEIKQFKFSPATLTVKVGDKITWKNLDIVPHTATANDKTWDSGNLKKNDEWSLVVETIGDINYICTYHPVMKGTLIVEE